MSWLAVSVILSAARCSAANGVANAGGMIRVTSWNVFATSSLVTARGPFVGAAALDGAVDVGVGADPFRALAKRSFTAVCARIAAVHASVRPGNVDPVAPGPSAAVPDPSAGGVDEVVAGADQTDGAVWMIDTLGPEGLGVVAGAEHPASATTAAASSAKRLCRIGCHPPQFFSV